MKTPQTDLDIVRSSMRSKFRKEAYRSARNALPRKLRQAYPHIYRELMDESLKGLSTYLDRETEAGLRLLHGSIPYMASRIRMRNAAERARRKRSRLQKEEPEC